MGIRVVKPTPLSEDEKEKKPADEAQMMRAVRAWVEEFKSSKDAARQTDLWQSQKR